MFQVTYQYDQPWPKNNYLRMESHLVYDIKISPAVARRKANGFLAGYVTMMVSAGQPTLILDESPVWRVPANLHLPKLGKVSTLGTIDVDAQTGEIIALTTDQITQMQELSHVIAAYFTSSTRSTG